MKFFLFPFFLLVLALFSCEDFIEKNLKKENIKLLSPVDTDTLNSNLITFWWEEIEAQNIRYNIKIVENSFDSPTQLILDSNTSNNIFEVELTEGLYEWQVKGINNSSETDVQTRSFYVGQSNDLSDHIQTLISPQNNFNTNILNQTFKWSINSSAENYDIEILDNSEDVYAYESVNTNIFNIDLIEGIYTWRVKAKNNSSESAFSTYRTILIDETAPASPLLIDPVNNAVQTNTAISFSWTKGSSLAEVTDTLYIYSDSLMTLYNKIYTTESQLDYNFSSLGTYFWRMKAQDASGNSSEYSDVRKFTIN